MLRAIAIGLVMMVALFGAERVPWSDVTWKSAGSSTSVIETTSFTIGGSIISVSVPHASLPVSRDKVLEWIGSAAAALSAYYGHFPVARIDVEIQLDGDGGINSGVTNTGRRISIALGKRTTPTDLDGDWVLTHEMVHLAFPDLDDRYQWMEEGLATYLEPLVRVRAGHLPAAKMWADLVEGLPQGQPNRDGGGLDDDHAWGRTYWGGAGFWLLADLRIRQQSAGRHSLDDVLRAVLAAGGDGSVTWPLERIFEVARLTTGENVLADLHQEMGSRPLVVDFDGWWTRLGIHPSGMGVIFDDKAPLAGLRQAIAR